MYHKLRKKYWKTYSILMIAMFFLVFTFNLWWPSVQVMKVLWLIGMDGLRLLVDCYAITHMQTFRQKSEVQAVNEILFKTTMYFDSLYIGTVFLMYTSLDFSPEEMFAELLILQ